MFGRILRRRRTAAGLSQEKLALAAGLHPVYISMLERGLRMPSLAVLLKLAKGLGMPISSLVADLDAK